MPELPDVETFRRYFESTSLHQEIKSVELVADEILADSLQSKNLRLTLKGNAFSKTDRHGKYLFVRLEEEPWMALHFGMTGNLHYFEHLSDQPEYTKARFDFTNGYHLGLIMPRKLGHIWILNDPDALIEKKDRGSDFMDEDFTEEKFIEKMKGRRGMIKSAFMDQSFICGLGNVYADEILF